MPPEQPPTPRGRSDENGRSVVLHLLKRIDSLEPVGGMSDAEYAAWCDGVAAARAIVEAEDRLERALRNMTMGGSQ